MPQQQTVPEGFVPDSPQGQVPVGFVPDQPVTSEQGVPPPPNEAELRKLQGATYVPEGKGAWGEVLSRLGGSDTLGGALKNLGESALGVGLTVAEHSGPIGAGAVKGWHESLPEASQASKAFAEGLEELWKEIGSPKYAKSQAYKGMGNFTGVSDLADAYVLSKRGDYGSAVGATISGLLKVAPAVAGKYRAPETAAAKRFKTLASGEQVRVTAGMDAPVGVISRAEPIIQAMPWTRPLTKATGESVTAGKSFLIRAMQSTAEWAKGHPVAPLPPEVETAAAYAARHVIDAGQELYKGVDEAVAQPGVQPVDFGPLAKEAESILKRQQIQDLFKRPDIDPNIRTELERIADVGKQISGEPALPPPDIPLTDPRMVNWLQENHRNIWYALGSDSAAEMIQNPNTREWFEQNFPEAIVEGKRQLSPVPEPPRASGVSPAETYQAAQSARERLLQLGRDKNLTPTERRLVGNVTRGLSSAIVRGLKTVRPGLAKQWLRANRITRSGYALQGLADSLQEMVQKYSPEAVQRSAGTSVRPVHLPSEQLISALNEMAEQRIGPKLRKGTSPALKAAFPVGQDAKTVQQIAMWMERAQQTGSIAAKFGFLGQIKFASMLAALPAGIAVGMHSGFAGAARNILFEQIGIYAISALMAYPEPRRLLLEYMKAVPGSARATSLALRLNTLSHDVPQDNGPSKWKVTDKNGKSGFYMLNPDEADMVHASGRKIEDAEEE